MRILVNALSATNQSGRHVLLGHLKRLAAWTQGEHQFLVLHHASNRDLVGDLGPNLAWLECPAGTSGWLRRALWERFSLPSVARRQGTDAYLSPAGVAAPSLRVPQMVFCQNPWALVPGLAHGTGDRAKALLQRRAYTDAVRHAQVMVFNSGFMREAYRQNAGQEPRNPHIVHQGIADTAFAAARRMAASTRVPNQIVAVSAMAPHKNIETTVHALHRLQHRHGVPATLKLVGRWPDRPYEERIRRLVAELGLTGDVAFVGHASVEELYRCYAQSRAFCLMSRCESFGIPAVEAQAFGTPVVSSSCCAIPEIVGEGGLLAPADDIERVTTHLHRLLADDREWQQVSDRARTNAERFHWDLCSRAFLAALSDLGA